MNRPIRAVLDTNIFISALSTDGMCRKVLQTFRYGLFILYVNEDILTEIKKVAKRNYFRKYFSVNLVDELIEIIKTKALIIKDDRNVSAEFVTSDPKDKHIVACVLSSKADVLVTGNKKHFQNFQNLDNKVKVLSPAEFLSYLTK